MAYGNQERDNRPNAPFDLFQLTLWAPSPTAPGKSAMFGFDVGIDGKVTARVRTGDPADKEKSKDGDVIRLTFGKLTDFEQFVQVFGDVVRSKEPRKECAVEQVWFRFNKETKQRERMDSPRDGVKLFVDKDRDGRVSLSLVQYNRTNIEFGFLPQRPEIVFAHGNGDKWTEGEQSQSAARAYHKILGELHQRVDGSRIRQHQVPDLYKPPFVPQKPGGNGGQGGGGGQNGYSGYNKGGSNGGGGGGNSNYQKPAPVQVEVDMDDDVPY